MTRRATDAVDPGSGARAAAVAPNRGVGPFVAICGIDGAGKSSLGRALAANLDDALGPGTAALLKLGRETVSWLFRSLVRDDPDFDVRSQDYVAAVERIRAAIDNLPPLQARNKLPIVDRYIFCHYAFSKALGRDVSYYAPARALAPDPAVTFLIDVPPEVAMQRILARGEELDERENVEVLSGARAAYLELVEHESFEVVDGRLPIELNATAMADTVLAAINSLVGAPRR